MKTKNPPVTLDILDDLRAVKASGKVTWDLQKKQGEGWRFLGNYPDLPTLLGAVVRRSPEALFPVGTAHLTLDQILVRFDETILEMSALCKLGRWRGIRRYEQIRLYPHPAVPRPRRRP